MPNPIRRTLAEQECTRLGDALRRAAWDPVAKEVGAAERVYVVPDGALHTVNFAALPAPKGGYLVEGDPLIQLLSAERDLAASPSTAAGGVLALGGPAFDDLQALRRPAADAQVASLVPAAQGHPDLGYRGAGSTCEDFRTLKFARLPGAEREVEDIAAVWKQGAGAADVLALGGARASEAEFRRTAPGRRIVHLATHGIFLGPECAGGKGGAALRQSPLLRSGVALAGANRRGDTNAVDDGILTAEEIASLDLAAAEWVVLSGCETGLGEIAADEGVLGMRRAFQVAGARTTIMSLWPVEDAASREWMKALHRAGREHGLDAARALRETARALLNERRAQGRSMHPATWAAFVAAGR
jgi:CHAT domain-containing protein